MRRSKSIISLIRRMLPWGARGASFTRMGKGVVIKKDACFNFRSRISLDDYVRIGRGCHIDGEGGVSIGEGTILAAKVTILSSSHIYEQKEYLPFNQEDDFRAVQIGRGVWLGYGCSVVPGVTIGDGAVVAMNSVVTSDVFVGEVVGGNPARVLKRRCVEDIQEMVENGKYYMKAVVESGLKRR